MSTPNRPRRTHRDGATFAARLNRLFATIYPPGRGPYNNVEVVRALSRRGCAVSGPYLSQLRTGQRTRPSRQMIDLLAEFFGVGSDYLCAVDSAYTRALEEELRWLELARNPAVRDLTTALLALAPPVRDQLLAAATNPRRRSGSHAAQGNALLSAGFAV